MIFTPFLGAADAAPDLMDHMMNFFTWLNDAILVIADPLFNWLLSLPMSLALFIVALMTSFLLTFTRKYTTNQDLLKRCDEDKTRLNQLIREDKARGDKAAVGRHKDVLNRIGVKVMNAEGKPLLVALIPIAILGTWAFNRLAYEPAPLDKPVKVVAHFRSDLADTAVHILPVESLVAPNGWIQTIEKRDLTPAEKEKKGGASAVGRAEWLIDRKDKSKVSEKPYELTIVHGEEKPLTVHLHLGQKTYGEVIDLALDEPCAGVELNEFLFLGKLPTIDVIIPWLALPLFIPSWLLGYLILAIIFFFIFKPALKIY